MGEVYIGLRLSPTPTIIWAILVDYGVFLFMVTREVDIGLRPDNFLQITIVVNTLSTQGYIKKIYQGLCKDKIHIKTILIILIQA